MPVRLRHLATRSAALASLALLGGCSRSFVVVDPQGPIAAAEKSVILIAVALMAIVVVPVIVMTFAFAWRYRASQANKAAYAPNWDRSRAIELVVWLVPAAIVAALGVLNWESSRALDPYKPLAPADARGAAAQAIPVDAIAMNWKWLFIYPEQHIASVNRLVFPAKAPLNLSLTSDTVTTSFFVPRLGSQIYAMPGMRTKLHLLAEKAGVYAGRNFQFSGRGYAWMRFKAVATSPQGFAKWVARVKRSPKTLDLAVLAKLEKPSVAAPVTYYASIRPDLFAAVIDQTMTASAAPPVPRTSNGA